MTSAALMENCLRWNRTRASYRPAGEVFDTTRAEVVGLDESDAKLFVKAHHYSGSYPAARFRAGIVVKPPFAPAYLGGVAVFSVPMTQSVIPATLALAPAHGVELGRFVLLDSLEANAETWFLGRAFRLLKRHLPEVKGVVAYCDPVERRNAAGELVKRSHTGTIYRAHNAIYRGQGKGRTLWLLPNGQVASERALSKLRSGECGTEYAARQLLEQGAPARLFAESGADWIERLKNTGFLQPLAHPGNHRFVWRLDGARLSPDSGTRRPE
ncbi:hypothetical protein F6X40_10370 [Paraburkholderia sp. UCT31]|uniref:Mom family adenine methylcarbamoylation protein n=1 Tax=Paraburkholderia sp. UCT31 TaxID=2615209 RepID=UPI0016562DB4|nr:hypothetical protein [Paraburkholderia sp. UCT31]MBC8737212.1 hypothetical protein [Paraburkholderia sp. UCT31]